MEGRLEGQVEGRHGRESVEDLSRLQQELDMSSEVETTLRGAAAAEPGAGAGAPQPRGRRVGRGGGRAGGRRAGGRAEARAEGPGAPRVEELARELRAGGRAGGDDTGQGGGSSLEDSVTLDEVSCRPVPSHPTPR